jgi:hypothetical protein
MIMSLLGEESIAATGRMRAIIPVTSMKKMIRVLRSFLPGGWFTIKRLTGYPFS